MASKMLIAFFCVGLASAKLDLRAKTQTQGLLGQTCLRQLAKHKCVDNSAPCKGVKIPGFCNTGVCCFEGTSDDCDKAGGKCIATKDCESDVFAAHSPHCPGSNEVKCCVNTKKQCQGFQPETKTYCSSKGHCEATKKVFAKDPSFMCGKAEGCCVGKPNEDEGCKAKGGSCKLAKDCQETGEIHDGRDLCPGKMVKCCVKKDTPEKKASKKREKAEKVQEKQMEQKVAKLQAEMAAKPIDPRKDKTLTGGVDPKTGHPKKAPPKKDVEKPAEDNQKQASLLEVGSQHKLREKQAPAPGAAAGAGTASIYPNSQGYAAPGEGVPEMKPKEELGVVTIPDAVLKAEHLEKQSQSYADSNRVEECVGCQFIVGQLQLLVGNTNNERLVSTTLTSLCYESMGTIVESACRWIHSVLDDITTDYLDGKDPGSICERNGLCRGGSSPLKPS